MSGAGVFVPAEAVLGVSYAPAGAGEKRRRGGGARLASPRLASWAQVLRPSGARKRAVRHWRNVSGRQRDGKGSVEASSKVQGVLNRARN